MSSLPRGCHGNRRFQVRWCCCSGLLFNLLGSSDAFLSTERIWLCASDNLPRSQKSPRQILARVFERKAFSARSSTKRHLHADLTSRCSCAAAASNTSLSSILFVPADGTTRVMGLGAVLPGSGCFLGLPLFSGVAVCWTLMLTTCISPLAWSF